MVLDVFSMSFLYSNPKKRGKNSYVKENNKLAGGIDMNKRIFSAVIIALTIFLSSLPVSASLYDIVCVECTLTNAIYEFTDSGIGNIASGNLAFPSVTGDFEIENFFGFPLVAHDVIFYWGTGTYNFDSVGDSVTPGMNISMTVNTGQVGMHFLFDWHGNTDIDVLNVFDVSYINSDTLFTPTDVDGNGIVGFAMVDGPFQGTDMATRFVVTTPIPSAVWLFGFGLLGLIGISRRKKSAWRHSQRPL
jgi:hypothetical protein